MAKTASQLVTNVQAFLDSLKRQYEESRREDDLLGWAIVLVERYLKSQKGEPFDLCSSFPKNGTPEAQRAWREKHERRIDEVYNRVVGCAVNTVWTLASLPGTPRDAAPDALKNFSWNSTAKLGAEATAVSRILALISHLTEEKSTVQFPNPAEALYQLATMAWTIQKENASGKLNLIGTLVECLHSILKSAACLMTELDLLSDDLAGLKASQDRLEKTAAVAPRPPLHFVRDPSDREEVRLACQLEAQYRGRKHGYLARGVMGVTPPYPFFEENRAITERPIPGRDQVRYRSGVTDQWKSAGSVNDACLAFCESRLEIESVREITNADGRTLACPPEDLSPNQRTDMVGNCSSLCCARLVNFPPLGGLSCGLEKPLRQMPPKIPDDVRRPAPDGKGCSDWVEEVVKTDKDFSNWCQRNDTVYALTPHADNRCRAHAAHRYELHHDAPTLEVCATACRKTALALCQQVMPFMRPKPAPLRLEDFRPDP